MQTKFVETAFTDASINSIVLNAASALGVAPSRKWNCIDQNDSLQLFHYNTEITPQGEVAKVRGLVYDPKEKVLVARSYSATPTVQVPAITLDQEGNLSFTDTDGGEHTLPKDSFYFKLGFEGTVMRVYKHGGKVYHSTHKRLDTSRSHWGNSPTFETIYNELGGPADEVLFDPSKDYSPYCHIFLMVHPKLLLSSLQDVGSGYLVYLGAVKMWENKYEEDKVDTELRTFATVSTLPEKHEEKFILSPSEISLEEANQHLEKGWSGKDGEFVIVYSREHKEGEMPRLFKFASPQYEKRLSVRNNDPSIYHRFVELSSQASGMNRDLFRTVYSAPEKTTLQERYQIVLEHYIKHLPLSMREEAVGFVDRFVQDRKDLGYWLTGLACNNVQYASLSGYKKVPQRIFALINPYLRQRKSAKVVNHEINTALVYEPGVSIYKMLRFMKTWKHHDEKRKN
ncbi:hypothetical protein [Cedratvirus kamchatka]|uniref:Polynucleotide kinase n=1 Tax=Cedratvirus kamchatka TaxID=2716914 RepID=A0A6G8MYP4_9VIRU|nr:hypothetical protein [Cedratvirus kamchatka]